MRLLAVYVATLAPACDRRELPSERDTQLVQAVAALRAGANSEKRPWLERLRHTPCDEPESCLLKDVCLRGYESHAAALDSTRAARHALESKAGDKESAKRSAALLVHAEQLLSRGQSDMLRCAALEQAWRRGEPRR